MCSRLVLVLLLMCVADSEARVVNNSLYCSEFFYKNEWPEGFENVYGYGNAHICQQLDGRDYFATMYSSYLRIPLYSAYMLDEFECKYKQTSRRSRWFIEPQLSDYYLDVIWTSEMSTFNEDWEQFFQNEQAVHADYRNTNYDRGHLNPSFYQCDEARTATFTLTNAVPQDPCFNRLKWFEMEKMSKQIMWNECIFPDAQRFFVTGVIPSRGTYIPFSEDDKEGDQDRGYNRVNVPYAMWTAACCYSSNSNDGFSFSYYGLNRPGSLIAAFTIADLRKELTEYAQKNVKIFTDDCFPSNRKAFNMLKQAVDGLNANTPPSNPYTYYN